MKRRITFFFMAALLVLMAVIAIAIYASQQNGRQTLSAFQSHGSMKAYFLDVGQGDSTLIVYPNNKTILIDAGNRQAGVRINGYLQKLNISSLDVVLATHNDADHIGGLERIVQDYKIGEYISNCKHCTTKICEELSAAVGKQNILSTCAKRGDRLLIDEQVDTIVLNPAGDLGGSNDNSIVLWLGYGDFSILLMGDCGVNCERSIFKSKAMLKADVLKVGHHGSRGSTTTELLKKASPRDAIISSGKNSFGHPSNETLSRLSGLTVFRTDQIGSIMLETSGQGYSIRQAALD